MEKTRYYLREPWPAVATLTEWASIGYLPKSFDCFKVSQHVRSLGESICSNWGEDRIDYFLPGTEFVSVLRLEKGQVTAAGPYRFISAEDLYIEVEDVEGKRLAHPKWLELTRCNEKLYKSTAEKIWMGHCFCEKLEDAADSVPLGCLCQVVLQRPCWKCRIDTTYQNRLKLHEEIQRQREESELDESLSQNVCLCSALFGDGVGMCYCGYRRTEIRPDESPSEDQLKLFGYTAENVEAMLDHGYGIETHPSSSKGIDKAPDFIPLV
ncbi:hypothetical protein R1sor_003767 [Riccia sorocarpa]|uniref:Uncharacterized protein n=1 Tax=Riccia sorocarpa TaxID=122646 RepID=A0ABD3H610_9MARC